MKEQFVPYEIAIKLKEKGFNEPCISKYEENYLCQDEGFDICLDDTWLTNKKLNRSIGKCIAAPLWQQVIDWFREKHQIEIVLSGITVYDIRKYHICLYYIVDGIMTDHAMLLFDEETREYAGYQTFTYPEARQAAIEHALTLI